MINEFVDYNVTAKMLADAGGRALGSIICKYRKLNGLGYNTYSKLYDTCVCPVLDYGSEVWGFKNYEKIDHIQNRAVRAFLGVHNFAPNLGIHGDMGWTYSNVRRKVNMVRYWNRLVNMQENRLTKKVFRWDRAQNSKAWSSDVKEIFQSIDLLDVYNNLEICSTDCVREKLHKIQCDQWSENMKKFPKLRTYMTFKTLYGPEPYVIMNTQCKYRSVLAQLRVGILPLEIEVGRWKSLELEQRLCKLCDSESIEDENHFMFLCPFYERERFQFIQESCSDYFNEMNINDKWKYIMSKEVVLKTAKYAWKIYNMRKNYLFS